MLRYKIDIVHGNNAVEAILAGRFVHKKIVWHIHGVGSYSKSKIKRYFMGVDKFISISHFSTANAVSSGIPAEKIVTIHNPTGPVQAGINQDALLLLKQAYAIPLNVPVVGIFGRLINWKGQLEFLKAAQSIIKKEPSVHFLIVGGDGENFGSYTKTLQSFVAANGLAQQVTFTGYIKNTNEHYQLCDIVVHASIEPEPFGLVIIEAMQNGAAVIAATTGAAPELVIHGVTGLIADPTNTHALADAIMLLINNSEVRAKYVAAAREHVNANMNPGYYAEQVAKVYATC